MGVAEEVGKGPFMKDLGILGSGKAFYMGGCGEMIKAGKWPNLFLERPFWQRYEKLNMDGCETGCWEMYKVDVVLMLGRCDRMHGKAVGELMNWFVGDEEEPLV